MKQFLLNLRFFAILALVAFGSSAQAKEFTYDFGSSIPNGWTASTAPLTFETADPSRGSQFTSSSVLTLKEAKNVTKVVITCSTNVGDKNSISLTINGKAFGSAVTLSKENNKEKTFSGSAATGDIAVNIKRSEKSVYIKKIVITADEIGTSSSDGDGGSGDGDGDTGLKDDYVYDEPTTLTATGTPCNNSAYSFIQNNVKVTVSTGAITDTYFGCNAGSTIQFTATKAIKAIVVNGYIKQNFSATASSGDIVYADASEDYVEANPVLAVTDVDSKTLTLSCDKQLRCYSVELYFDENPDVDIDNGDSNTGTYNFDYEPTTPTTLNITCDNVDAADYSDYLGYNYSDIYLSNDDLYIEIGVYAPLVDGTILAPGTYEINSTYEDGTVQASPGGDEDYDYPTFIATGFKYDEDYNEYYYTIAYYLESGTLTVSKEGDMAKFVIEAKSHYGSTIKATFIGNLEDAEGIKDVNTNTRPTNTKQLRNGRIVIVKDDKTYDLTGRAVKN